jgi:LacI family transcriptional regulator
VAIASFDDLPVMEVFHLTAVAQPAYQIGFRGAELLIQRVEHQLNSRKRIVIRLEPELKIRQSTAAMRLSLAQTEPSSILSSRG